MIIVENNDVKMFGDEEELVTDYLEITENFIKAFKLFNYSNEEIFQVIANIVKSVLANAAMAEVEKYS